MAAVRVAGRVGVVLEQVDVPADALLAQPGLRPLDQRGEDPLPRLVVDHQFGDVVALGSGVLGMAADVEVEPGAVLQEHVGRAPPAHHPAEEVAGHLVGAEPTLAAQGAGHPVLVLQAVDPLVHYLHGTVGPPRRHQPGASHGVSTRRRCPAEHDAVRPAGRPAPRRPAAEGPTAVPPASTATSRSAAAKRAVRAGQGATAALSASARSHRRCQAAARRARRWSRSHHRARRTGPRR